MWCVASHFHLMANSTQAPVQILIPAFLLPFLVFFFSRQQRRVERGTAAEGHWDVHTLLCRLYVGRAEVTVSFSFGDAPLCAETRIPRKVGHRVLLTLFLTLFSTSFHIHTRFFPSTSSSLARLIDWKKRLILCSASLTHLFLIITLCPTYSDTIPCSAIIDRGITVFKIEDTKRASSRSSFDSAVNV